MSVIDFGRKKKPIEPDFVPITDSTTFFTGRSTQGVYDGIGATTSGKGIFCMSCGQQLPDGARFCFRCGESVGITIPRGSNQRRVLYDGEVIKCPSCGENLPAFTPVCPACGHELRNAKSSTAVQRLSDEIARLEKERAELMALELDASKSKGVIKTLLTRKKNDKSATELIDTSIANTIRSFAVPNTKEDVFEFMALATANIDVAIVDEEFYDSDTPEERSQKIISKAWKAKSDQVYEKAKLTFGDSPDFNKIKGIYNTKKREKMAKDRNEILTTVAALLLSFLCMGFFVFIMWISKTLFS